MKLISLAAFSLTLALAMVCSTPAAPAPAEKPGWKLTFDDEFDGHALDLKKWTPQDPWQRERNREFQAYVPDAFTVENGILSINAEKRHATYDGKDREYTSGMMSTVGKFSQRYGRFEIRCRVPAGRGFWPAFWLLPDPRAWPPEIDVMEILGEQPEKIYLTHHFRNAQGEHKSHGGVFVGPDFSKGFHEFAVEWSPQSIVWFVDGIERCRSEDSIPQTKMFILVNLAVGGDWPKPPDETTKFPSRMEVDYVRVYEKLP